MTIEQRIRELLKQHGLKPEDTDEVINRVKAVKTTVRWSDDVECSLLPVLWASVKATALGYIDETMPKAWYREMFL